MSKSDKRSFVKSDVERITGILNRTVETNAKAIHREFSGEMLSEFAKNTPVDSGNARGSWVVSTDGSSPSRQARLTKDGRVFSRFLDKDPSAAKTVKRGRKAMNSSKVGGTITISNNASVKNHDGSEDHYIVQLENGRSSQAKNGFFRKFIARAPAILKKAQTKLSGGS